MKTFNCTQCHIDVKQVKPMVIPHCPNCGSWMHMEEVIENTILDDHLVSDERAKQPQVDFEMLKKYVDDTEDHCKEWNNLALFFHLLSTKPTFAKIAYENLKRLNK